MDEQGKFEFIKELGRGSFGSVVLARNTKTGEQVRLCKLPVCAAQCGLHILSMCACLLHAGRRVPTMQQLICCRCCTSEQVGNRQECALPASCWGWIVQSDYSSVIIINGASLQCGFMCADAVAAGLAVCCCALLRV
jgi:serine/threonine protein kinase